MKESPRIGKRLVFAALLVSLVVGGTVWAIWSAPSGAPSPGTGKSITLIPAAEPAEPPEPEGPVVPGPEVNVHRSDVAEEGCLGCHETNEGPALRLASLAATCARCHGAAHDDKGSHPVAIGVPESMATTLPLAAGRKIDCHTCHDPHGKGRAMLRGKSPMEMCSDCHKGY